MYSHETTQYKAIVDAYNEFSDKLFSIVEASKSMEDVERVADTIEDVVDIKDLIQVIKTTEYAIVRKPYEMRTKMIPVVH